MSAGRDKPSDKPQDPPAEPQGSKEPIEPVGANPDATEPDPGRATRD